MTGRNLARLNVNGEKVELEVPASELLLDTLRNRLGLTSVRGTCGIGICGSCTVLMDGRAVSSCITLSALSEEREIVTSEGLGDKDRPDPVQEEFIAKNAFQCSYCIPAMVLSVRAYLDSADRPSVAGALEALGGNLCRCGSYPQVIEAVTVLVAAEERP